MGVFGVGRKSIIVTTTAANGVNRIAVRYREVIHPTATGQRSKTVESKMRVLVFVERDRTITFRAIAQNPPIVRVGEYQRLFIKTDRVDLNLVRDRGRASTELNITVAVDGQFSKTSRTRRANGTVEGGRAGMQGQE